MGSPHNRKVMIDGQSDQPKAGRDTSQPEAGAGKGVADMPGGRGYARNLGT